MKNFLHFLDDNILKYSIIFAIFFIPLYPKVPSIGISHVWVYIRLEDFLIFLVTLIWFIQLLRKKVSLPRPEGYALVAYWIIGLITLIYCLLFVASHLANFFPQIAALEWLRRIEYMILFFAAYASVKKPKDVIVYLTTFGIALACIILYGFGQKFYPVLWDAFPTFFKSNQFCFPAFLTGNEEFAKGVPLCLNSLSRIASTFGGNYDLSSYLVMVIPLFIALFMVQKKIYLRVLTFILVLLALEMLNFTSSRTAYLAYLMGVISMLIIWKKKLWIVPVLLVSIGVLFVFSTSTLQRFAKTIQQVQIVQVQPGSSDKQLQQIIEKSQQTQANTQPQSPPPGTVTVGEGANNSLTIASQSGQEVITNAELKSLQEQNISSVSGSFLLNKAYAIDVSLTTRFQAEWPRDWQAFLGSPLFGTGYSSLTLASDNDYLRALGETGLAGAFSFFFIFLIFGIFMKNVLRSTEKDPIIKAFLFGLAGGIIGLLVNAILIDVFESSKVAESFWILAGIAVGTAKLYHKEPIPYKKDLRSFFTSHVMICLYLFVAVIGAYIASIGNFFVADDFTWLHWAATATISDLPKYFINAQGFFYRPLDKVIIYFLYEIFSFQQQGFHLFIIILHFITAVGVYYLAKKLSNNKLVGAISALLFALHPAHSENLFWISALSDDISSLFIVYMMLAFICFREKKSVIAYIVSIILGALAFLSYEIAVVVPFILIALDIFILKPKWKNKAYLSYIPFVVLFVLYFVMRVVSHSFSGGGDYSYHLARFFPNVFGNIFGYTGLYLGGLPFLNFYNFLRSNLRSEWIYFTIVALLIIGYLIWILSLYRKKAKEIVRNKNAQLIIFSLIFAIISLVPFLPLGNIAPRYLYLSSVGYTLAIVVILRIVFINWIKTPKYALISLLVVSAILATIYFVSDLGEELQWQNASNITQNTLLFFRRNYDGFTSKTQVYVINTPVEKDNAWVFPVGISDGMWFIYREETPQVHEVGSIDDAENAINPSNSTDSYIFSFDQQGNIKRVK